MTDSIIKNDFILSTHKLLELRSHTIVQGLLLATFLLILKM
jgi:hypothetical protein